MKCKHLSYTTLHKESWGHTHTWSTKRQVCLSKPCNSPDKYFRSRPVYTYDTQPRQPLGPPRIIICVRIVWELCESIVWELCENKEIVWKMVFPCFCNRVRIAWEQGNRVEHVFSMLLYNCVRVVWESCENRVRIAWKSFKKNSLFIFCKSCENCVRIVWEL